jgi:C4-type Zn-finger protein
MASNHSNAQVHIPRGSIQCPRCAQVFAITATPQSTPYAAQVLSLGILSLRLLNPYL